MGILAGKSCMQFAALEQDALTQAGLMGAVGRGAKAAGGHVVGIIPEFMKARELAFTDADELDVLQAGQPDPQGSAAVIAARSVRDSTTRSNGVNASQDSLQPLASSSLRRMVGPW